MDTETGRIYDSRNAALALGIEACKLMEMQVAPSARQRTRGHVGRNEPCPCGSGKKFKSCCNTCLRRNQP